MTILKNTLLLHVVALGGGSEMKCRTWNAVRWGPEQEEKAQAPSSALMVGQESYPTQRSQRIAA